MTAKLLGIKFFWEDVKRRSWLMALSFVGALALLPFALQLKLSTLEYTGNELLYAENAQYLGNAKMEAAARILGGGNSLIFLGCLIAAVVSAVTGFAYLQSTRQVDFYHSLPLRRERLFFSRYLSGFLMVVVPYLLSVVAALFWVGGAHGVFCGELAGKAAQAVSFFLMLYLMFYTLSVLAVLLTGRVLTSLMLTAFFSLYGVLCTGMLRGMMSCYFKTYYDVSWKSAWGEFLSPLSLGGGISDCLRKGEAVPAVMWIIMAATAAVLLLLCVIVYRRRPSEAAGNAFSYRWMEPVLKVAVIIPASLWAGVLLRRIGYLEAPFMAALVAVLSALVLSGVFEFIYSQDLKNIWRHKISGIVGIAGTLVILLAFQGDWFGYDSWQPREDQVEAMAFYDWNSDDVFQEYGWYFDEQEQKVLEHGMTEDFQPIYQLAGTAIGRLDNTEENAATTRVIVHYRLKNGFSAYRMYDVLCEEADGVMGKLSEEQEFREKNYPVNSRNLKNVTEISVCDWNDLRNSSVVLSLTQEEKKEFLEIFQEESSSYAYLELKNMTPIGMIRMYCDFEGGRGGYYEETDIGYYLYPVFEKTIDYIQKKGIYLREEPDTSEIVSVQMDYLTNVETSDSEDMAAVAYSQLYFFNTKESIDELLGQLVRVRMSDYLDYGEFVSLQIMYSDGMYSTAEFKVRDREKFRKFLEDSGAELAQ